MDARDEGDGIEPTTLLEVDLGVPLGQLRAVPVGVGDETRLLLVHAADAEVDPYMNMFFYPEDTLTFTLLTLDGDVCWAHDCGRGVVPGVWFCPVLPFDLDGDGVEEIWFVDNVDDEHPFSLDGYRLARIDPRSGAVTGRWAWPVPEPQTMSHRYRNVVLGGHVGDEPVLVTAQGTYGPMHLQGWDWDRDAGVSPRWTHDVAADDPGARGSHMTPVLDLDGDGTDELLWGERVLELDRGTELFCADRDRWDGHSDVVQPTRHPETGEWYVYLNQGESPAVHGGRESDTC